ncbi:MAG: hypothetical protein PWQ55_2395 [Chloroflexota bacterium]|nr:hypothetical protein [Chloroflexota bacterium]
MKNFTVLLVLSFLIVSLAGCGGASRVDVDATVQAGIQGTQTAEANVSSLVNEAVAATLTAMPTPTPVPVEELSEEELAQAVEDSAGEAAAAADQASTASDAAASDGEITQDELDDLYYLYYLAIDEAEQALALAEDYYDLYADLMALTISELEQIEAQLENIEESANAVLTVLDEISQTVAQGGEIAQQTLDNLQQMGQPAAQYASELQNRLPDWRDVRANETGTLVEQALSVAPTDVAGTRAGAIAQLKDYVQSMQTAIGDGRLSLDELHSLSQLGANAAASLSQFNGGDLAGLSDAVTGLTRNFASGQLPELNRGLGSLQNSLPSIR